jgi:hypothetical protein
LVIFVYDAEIQTVIDKLPENKLKQLLVYLKEIERKPTDDSELVAFIKHAFDEDRELLEKLAQ